MKKTFEIEIEEDNLVPQILKDHIGYCDKIIERSRDWMEFNEIKEDSPGYDIYIQDIRDSKELKRALTTVHNYFSKPEDHL